MELPHLSWDVFLALGNTHLDSVLGYFPYASITGSGGVGGLTSQVLIIIMIRHIIVKGFLPITVLQFVEQVKVIDTINTIEPVVIEVRS